MVRYNSDLFLTHGNLRNNLADTHIFDNSKLYVIVMFGLSFADELERYKAEALF